MKEKLERLVLHIEELAKLNRQLIELPPRIRMQESANERLTAQIITAMDEGSIVEVGIEAGGNYIIFTRVGESLSTKVIKKL